MMGIHTKLLLYFFVENLFGKKKTTKNDDIHCKVKTIVFLFFSIQERNGNCFANLDRRKTRHFHLVFSELSSSQYSLLWANKTWRAFFSSSFSISFFCHEESAVNFTFFVFTFIISWMLKRWTITMNVEHLKWERTLSHSVYNVLQFVCSS